MSRIAVYLDQDVGVSLTSRLRANGYNAVTTREAGNIGKPDEEQLKYAAARSMAILTHNRRHFRRLHRDWIASGREHSDVIVSRHLPLEDLEKRMLNLLHSVSAEDAKNTLFSLADFL